MRRWILPWRLLQGAVALIVVGGVWLAARHMGFASLVETVLAYVRDAGPVTFFMAMAVLPAVGFPLLPFALTAGPAFGPSLGIVEVILLSALAVMANAALAYGIAARWLAPFVERRRGRLPLPSAGTTFHLVFILRLVPGLPFWVQSYLLGLFRAPFLPYMVVSTLVPAGYLTGVILCSTAWLQGRREIAGFAFGAILLVGTVMHWVRKHYAAELKEVRAQTETLWPPR